MAILTKGTTFATNDQVTATKLNNLVDAATFDATGAVDNSSTVLSSGAIIVKDLGISTGKIAANAVTAAKISAGGPTWDASGNTVITGTTTNDNAASGKVGELISSLITAASGAALTSEVVLNVTSISLTAGDWDVSGYAYFYAVGATNIDGSTGVLVSAGITPTSATLPGADTGTQGDANPFNSNGTDYQVMVPTARVSLSSTTTYYLVAKCKHNGNVNVAGSIRARRMR